MTIRLDASRASRLRCTSTILIVDVPLSPISAFNDLLRIAAMLCEFSKNFPPKIAELLGRAKALQRPFREETATDLLLMGLLGLQGLGVSVDFSKDEKNDGADMEWLFVSPLDLDGGSYIRLLIQAKVAKLAKRKKPYWYYNHLDHKAGKQCKNLMAAAASSPQATLPLYLLFHPEGNGYPSGRGYPPVEGVNLVLAQLIEPVVGSGCGVKGKKVERWHPHFMPLSTLLCWPPPAHHLSPDKASIIQLFLETGGIAEVAVPGAWHPDFVASRLNDELERVGLTSAQSDGVTRLEAQPITPEIRRLLDGEETSEDQQGRANRRVVFKSSIRRGGAGYRLLADRTHRNGLG